MLEIIEFLKKYDLKPLGYRYKNNVVIVTTNKKEKVVLKPRKRDKQSLFNYLKSRSFNYFPVNYNMDEKDDYDIYEYLEDYNIPSDSKANDLISIVSLLHAKTTRYQEIDIDDYKKIYEDIDKDIKYLKAYYDDLFNLIDSEIYMSPSNYLLARNITKINSLMNYLGSELEEWYAIVKENKKQRKCMIHNNLSLDHLIRNDGTYLISWDMAKVDFPVYDLYNFYRKNYEDIDFYELLVLYQKHYPLLLDEVKLLFILISMPWKIEFELDEYNNTKKVNELLTFIYKTDKVISEYYPNNEEEKNENFNK